MRIEDQDVIKDGRENPLKDVEVSLREQQLESLAKKLEELGEGARTVEIWNQGNARRQEWLTRRERLLEHYDEFIKPIYTATNSWSSTLHLPIALIHAKTLHARFLAALMGVDPPFTVTARKATNQDRSLLVQNLM